MAIDEQIYYTGQQNYFAIHEEGNTIPVPVTSTHSPLITNFWNTYTMRKEALDQAIKGSIIGIKEDTIIKKAEAYYNFLLGQGVV